MITVRNHLKLLGFKAKDKITGLEGTITHVGFDLYGCVQTIINPGLDKDGKPREPLWFDIQRLEILGKKPVMQAPVFDYYLEREVDSGPAEKPSRMPG